MISEILVSYFEYLGLLTIFEVIPGRGVGDVACSGTLVFWGNLYVLSSSIIVQ
jgi:hypothetical protein